MSLTLSFGVNVNSYIQIAKFGLEKLDIVIWHAAKQMSIS